MGKRRKWTLWGRRYTASDGDLVHTYQPPHNPCNGFAICY